MRARCFEMREDHRAHGLILWVDMHVEFFSCLNSRMSLQSSVKASSLIRFRKRKFYTSGPGHVVGHMQYASEDSNRDGTDLLAKKKLQVSSIQAYCFAINIRSQIYIIGKRSIRISLYLNFC